MESSGHFIRPDRLALGIAGRYPAINSGCASALQGCKMQPFVCPDPTTEFGAVESGCGLQGQEETDGVVSTVWLQRVNVYAPHTFPVDHNWRSPSARSGKRSREPGPVESRIVEHGPLSDGIGKRRRPRFAVTLWAQGRAPTFQTEAAGAPQALSGIVKAGHDEKTTPAASLSNLGVSPPAIQ